MPSFNDTIYALASASGKAGVSVIRISGPGASQAIEKLTDKKVLPRQASLRLLRHPVSKEPIDRVLLLWFPAPHSFTGEDVLEIHAHGSHAVVEKLFSVLSDFNDYRLAEPGEYSRRAFENGKMDLTAVEGLADLINAQTEGQLKQALRQSEGALAKLYESWRKQILSISAMVEALVDFSDEEDIDEVLIEQARKLALALMNELKSHLEESGRRGEQMRDGFRLVLAGAPNVGKSSLLNVLANRDVAIVTSNPGTTRDVIEVHLDIAGFPVLVMDTAGIRETEEVIEKEGIKRSLERLRQADLILWLQDIPDMDEDAAFSDIVKIGKTSVPIWKILSKYDLHEDNKGNFVQKFDLCISTKTEKGVDRLLEHIEKYLCQEYDMRDAPLITRSRHRQEVKRAMRSLCDFLDGSMQDAELRAEDLRLASNALGRLTGRIDVEELLGQIFGEFCIGK